MIILINGPAQSGKDTFITIARRLVFENTIEYQVSAPLKECFRTIFRHLPEALLKELLEKNKDQLLNPERTITPRNFQIDLYDMLSKQFGEDILGDIAVRRMSALSARHIFVQGGKHIEAQKIIDHFGYGDMGMVILSRPDTSYDDDCREEFCLKDYEHNIKHIVELDNCHDMDMYEVQVKRLLTKWGLIK